MKILKFISFIFHLLQTTFLWSRRFYESSAVVWIPHQYFMKITVLTAPESFMII